MKTLLFLAVCCLSMLAAGCQNADTPANKKAADQVGPIPVPTEKLDRVGH